MMRAKHSEASNSAESESAIRRLKSYLRRYKRRVVVGSLLWVASIPMILIGVGLAALLNTPFGLVWLGFGLVSTVPALMMTSIQPKVPGIEELENLDDARLIGPLIEVLDVCSNKEKNLIRERLIHLLRLVRERDCATIDFNPLKSITDRIMLMEYWQDADLAIAFINAYCQIGDERTLEYLRKLAAMKDCSASEKRILDAVRQILPEYELRIARQREGKDLLRASGSPGETSELLRPVSHTETADTQELLRPVE